MYAGSQFATSELRVSDVTNGKSLLFEVKSGPFMQLTEPEPSSFCRVYHIRGDRSLECDVNSTM